MSLETRCAAWAMHESAWDSRLPLGSSKARIPSWLLPCGLHNYTHDEHRLVYMWARSTRTQWAPTQSIQEQLPNLGDMLGDILDARTFTTSHAMRICFLPPCGPQTIVARRGETGCSVKCTRSTDSTEAERPDIWIQ